MHVNYSDCQSKFVATYQWQKLIYKHIIRLKAEAFWVYMMRQREMNLKPLPTKKKKSKKERKKPEQIENAQ